MESTIRTVQSHTGWNHSAANTCGPAGAEPSAASGVTSFRSGQVVLTVPQKPGAKYRDAWNGLELTPAIENGMARISLTLDPQQPGCVVQSWNP